MKQLRTILAILSGAMLASSGLVHAEPAPANFEEVLSLIRSNITSVSSKDLDRLAIEGLLSRLDDKVTLVSGEPVDTSAVKEPALAASKVYEESMAYVRLSRIEEGVAGQLASVCQQISATNQIKGLVLDLRFARGQDYQAAADVADLFFSANKSLFQIGGVMMRSTAKEKPFPHPVAVLVNAQTRGAAEALAAVLRHHKAGLVIGGATAGQAVSYREYPLSNGQKLRIATGSVRLGSELTLLHKSLEPDIKVQVSPVEERAYLDDAYKIFPHETHALSSGDSGTQSEAPRRLTNEAELVRRHREGQQSAEDVILTPVVEPEPAKPQVRDPALVRALDLLKGLALIKAARPS